MKSTLTKKSKSRWKKILGDILTVAVMLTALITTSIMAPKLHKTYLKMSTAKHVYRIFEDINRESGGTGFDITVPSGKNYVLTNSHICKMAGKNKLLYIENQIGMGMFRKIVADSKQTDLCLLEGVPEKDGLEIANKVYENQTLTVIGHPMLLPITVRQGEILGQKDVILFEYDMSDKRNKKKKCDLPKNKIDYVYTFFGMKFKACFTVINSYITDIEAYPGNSGSPVINGTGGVVGVIFAINTRSNWAYFIPLEDIKEFIKKY